MNLINIIEIAIGVFVGCGIFVFIGYLADKIKEWLDHKKYGN